VQPQELEGTCFISEQIAESVLVQQLPRNSSFGTFPLPLPIASIGKDKLLVVQCSCHMARR